MGAAGTDNWIDPGDCIRQILAECCTGSGDFDCPLDQLAGRNVCIALASDCAAFDGIEFTSSRTVDVGQYNSLYSLTVPTGDPDCSSVAISGGFGCQPVPCDTFASSPVCTSFTGAGDFFCGTDPTTRGFSLVDRPSTDPGTPSSFIPLHWVSRSPPIAVGTAYVVTSGGTGSPCPDDTAVHILVTAGDCPP